MYPFTLMNSREEKKTAQEQNILLLVGQHILFLQLRTVSEQSKKKNSVQEKSQRIFCILSCKERRDEKKRKKKRKGGGKNTTNTVEGVLCVLGFILHPFLVLFLSKPAVAQIPLNITELWALLSHWTAESSAWGGTLSEKNFSEKNS